MTTLTVGLIQMTSGIVMQDNIDHLTQAVQKLCAQGAELIVTPEMTGVLDQKSDRLRLTACDEETDPCLQSVQLLAQEHRVTIVLGSQPIHITGDRLVNRSFVIDQDGKIIARYDKIHLFDVTLPDGTQISESKSFKPGKQAVIVDHRSANLNLKIGLSICYDLRFPLLYRKLAQSGAHIITIPAAFTTQTGSAHWESLIRARAIETGSFILAPAQAGHHQDGRETWGHSLIVSPWGKILGQGSKDQPELLLAEIDLQEVHQARARIPAIMLDKSWDMKNF